mgnify:CR=1 FL=1
MLILAPQDGHISIQPHTADVVDQPDLRVFYLDVLDGSAAFPSNVDLRQERHTKLARSGIPPTPNVVITKGGEPTLCIGTECEAADFGLGARKTHWFEVE